MENLIFIAKKDTDGGYNARAANEPIFTQADTLIQLNINIKEAIECHFDEKPFPSFTLKFVD